MIFYFSGTGNSRWAARYLAGKTGEQLVYIPDVIDSDCRFDLPSDDRIGFVFPIHGWRPPLLVLKFIDKLRLDFKGHYCYALVTAGDSIGKAMDYLGRALFAKGMHVDSCFSLIMPESYVGLPFMDVDTESRELKKKAKAASDLRQYTDVIMRRQKGVSELTLGPLPGFFSGPVGSFFVNHIVTDKPFRVDAVKCIGCGKCEKVCPVGDIVMIGDDGGRHPEWKHNGECLVCFSCYHHCPTKAIAYGWRTKHKGQYYYTMRKQDNTTL